MTAQEDRRAAIAAAVDTGLTFGAVAQAYGVSRQRVAQIYLRERGRGVGRHIGHLCPECETMVYERQDQHIHTDVHQASLKRRRARRAIERFWSRVKRGNGCWEWDGAHTPEGYSQCNNAMGLGYAHRVAYVLVKGPIPEGLSIDHLCRNRGCVNPDHLEAVTYRENILRSPIALASINAAKTHCRVGHEYTESNTIWDRGRRGRTCRSCNNARSKARYREKVGLEGGTE